MIYSCFNQQTGLYDYFEDTLKRPINADLPIPKLPPSTGRIGVPSIEAGRPLPADAVHRGRGWHARGMVVQCTQQGKGLGQTDTTFEWSWWKAAGAGAFVGVVFAYLGSEAMMFRYGTSKTEKSKARKHRFSSSMVQNSLLGGTVGLLAFYAAKKA